MLETIKRWLGSATPFPGLDEIQSWADGRGHQFKLPREGEGFVVEATNVAPPWRLEWGPSQRDYIAGQELRLRGELGGANELQMLLLTSALTETLERRVYEHFTEGLQTRNDAATPEETRWLVMYPRASAAELKELNGRYAGTANIAHVLSQWLDGPMCGLLANAHGSWLATDDPLVLIVHRGRLTMRAPLAAPDPARVAPAVALFETALREARRVAETGSPDTTQPGLWGRGA